VGSASSGSGPVEAVLLLGTARARRGPAILCSPACARLGAPALPRPPRRPACPLALALRCHAHAAPLETPLSRGTHSRSPTPCRLRGTCLCQPVWSSSELSFDPQQAKRKQHERERVRRSSPTRQELPCVRAPSADAPQRVARCSCRRCVSTSTSTPAAATAVSQLSFASRSNVTQQRTDERASLLRPRCPIETLRIVVGQACVASSRCSLQ
jgi:hypothetical protein